MPRLSVNGVDLYYEEQGEGIPVLGVHGRPGSAVMWTDAAMELARHGRCIIYDRRGFHRSAPPVPFETLDLADHVDDAAAVLAGLHAGPAVVIGRSTGGLIAIELARRFPDKVKALVLLEPPCSPSIRMLRRGPAAFGSGYWSDRPVSPDCSRRRYSGRRLAMRRGRRSRMSSNRRLREPATPSWLRSMATAWT